MGKTTASGQFEWLSPTGKMAGLIRETDWSKTSIGNPDKWPLSLKSLINLCLDSLDPAYVWWGPEFINFYNDAYIEIAGTKHPYFIGAPAKTMWPEIWETVETYMNQVFRGEIVRHENHHFKLERNGTLEDAYFTFAYLPARNDVGKINGIFCNVKETTSEIRAEAEALAANNQLNEFFMQAPAPLVIMLGPEHKFWLANSPYENFVGRKVVGKKVSEAFSHEEVKDFIPLLDKVYKTGTPYIGKEIPFISVIEGAQKTSIINIGYHPFRQSDGTVKGILAIIEDVTESVLLRKEIEQKKNELEVLCEMIPQIVWTSTPEGILDYTNRRWVDYSGSRIPSEWADYVHPEDLDRTAKAWIHSVETGDDYEIEFRLRRKDGNYHTFLVRAYALRNDRGHIVKWYGTCTDIEDNKITLEELKKEKIIREQFVAMLTHDLRNPLSAAKMTAQILTRSNLPPEKQNHLAFRIIDNLNRVNKMIENLLDANRIKAGEKLPLKIEEVGLISLINEALIDLSTVHGDRFELKTNKDVINGYWSHDGLLRIIENLCHNAVKFGREHTPISVIVKDENERIQIKVHNFGKAINPEDQQKLFETYTRLDTDKNKISGWGLGLTLVRGLAEAQGGTVTLTSNEEDGTTFTVTIPKNAQPSV